MDPAERILSLTDGAEHSGEIDAVVGELMREAVTDANFAGKMELLDTYVDEIIVQDDPIVYTNMFDERVETNFTWQSNLDGRNGPRTDLTIKISDDAVADPEALINGMLHTLIEYQEHSLDDLAAGFIEDQSLLPFRSYDEFKSEMTNIHSMIELSGYEDRTPNINSASRMLDRLSDYHQTFPEADMDAITEDMIRDPRATSRELRAQIEAAPSVETMPQQQQQLSIPTND